MIAASRWVRIWRAGLSGFAAAIDNSYTCSRCARAWHTLAHEGVVALPEARLQNANCKLSDGRGSRAVTRGRRLVHRQLGEIDSGTLTTHAARRSGIDGCWVVSLVSSAKAVRAATARVRSARIARTWATA